jgi:Methyltransferase domain
MWRSIELGLANLAWPARWRAAPSPESAERKRIFEWIHQANAWGDPESASGPGSGLARASLFRDDFEALIRELAVRTLLDAPCGDFNWLRHFELPVARYVGVDIVPALIAANRERARSRKHRFMVRDIVCDALPRADLILCRDALIHLTHAEIVATLKNFRRSGATWLLTNTWPAHPDNVDIETGSWRTLNLEAAPFCFPPPLRVIDERCFGGGGAYRDKSLALWRLASLPL